jgi:hypothetical protein
MDYQVKTLCRQNNEKYPTIAARGLIDRQAFLRLMRALVELAKPLNGCKVLLDLQDATCDLGLEELIELKLELGILPWTAVDKLKLAMVTSPHLEQYYGLRQVTLPVAQLGIDVAVFAEEKKAMDWLGEATGCRVS